MNVWEENAFQSIKIELGFGEPDQLKPMYQAEGDKDCLAAVLTNVTGLAVEVEPDVHNLHDFPWRKAIFVDE